MKYVLTALAFAASVVAQSGAYAQCGGKGWTGSTTCVSGYMCVYNNDWYSQCLPGVPSSTKTSSAPSTTTTSPPAGGKLKWVGVDESVAEFGQGKYPGVWGVDFRFPDETAIGVSGPLYHWSAM